MFGPGRIDDSGEDVRRHVDRERVEVVRIDDLVSQLFQGGGERRCAGVHAARDPAQSFRTVIDGVHRGDHGQQNLRGTDIARRLLTPDVLLARLQGHAQAGAAGAILGNADDAPGQMALELIARRKECGVGAAVPERHAEALRVAHGDVRAPLARGYQQGEREQIGRDGHEGAAGVGGLAQRAVVADRAIGGRILDQRADRAALELERARIGDDDIDPAHRGPRAHNGDRLGMAVHIHEIGQPALVLRDRLGQMHRLSSRSAFVEQ